MQSSSSEYPSVQLGLHFVVETVCHKEPLTEVTPLGGWGVGGGKGKELGTMWTSKDWFP